MLGNTNKIHVWRKPDERLRPECLGEFGDKERTCRVSVIFWGCISYHGVGTLTPVDWNINTEKSILILDDNLWPVVAQHLWNWPWIFQEDNAPCHVSARANEWKREIFIGTLQWSAQSSGLNIIENVWKTIKIAKILTSRNLDKVRFAMSLHIQHHALNRNVHASQTFHFGTSILFIILKKCLSL